MGHTTSQRRNEIETLHEGSSLGGLLHDLLLARRRIFRRPGFALIVVITLAVGIGPNVAIFSVIKAMVLEPLPYPEPDRLVQVWTTPVGSAWQQPFSYPDYLDLRDESSCFDAFGAISPRSYNIGDGEPVRVEGFMATAGALHTYGVEPSLGRFFTRAEVDDGSRVVILGDQLWRERYNADPDIIGTNATISGEAHVVVGVMPVGAEFLSPWTRAGDVKLWTPLEVPPFFVGEEGRGRNWLLAIGRLKVGVEWKAAEAELKSIAAVLQQQHPESNASSTIWINPFLQQIVGGMSGQLAVLLGAVGLVLLIAVANVASLLLARGAGRQQEIAILASLGACRTRIISQQLMESLMLSLLGGAAGILLGTWCIFFLRSIIPASVPRSGGIAMDGGAILFALVLAPLVGLASGLVPALTASRASIMGNIRQSSGTVTGSIARNRMLRGLVVTQLAVVFLLTNGAVLLVKSYRNVLNTPQVFDTDEVLTANISLAGGEGDPAADQARVDFWESLLERCAALPGVERAAVTTKLPIEGGSYNGSVLVEGESYDPERQTELIERSFVSPGYFEAMGIPLLAGRAMEGNEGTDAERVAVVNRAFVDLYWPNQNALGQRIRQDAKHSQWSAVVVGVVENVRQWGAEYRPLPEIYQPYRHFPEPDSKLIIRGSSRVLSLVPAIRQQVLDLDSNQPISDVRTMGQVLSGATRGRQFLLLLVSLFAVIAVLLAAAGVYGIMSHNVAQRSREIGIRVAFGAVPSDLVSMVLRQAVKLAGIGLVLGSVLFLLSTGVINNQLYGVNSINVLPLAAGSLILLTVSLFASVVPAWKTTRFDPIRALHGNE
ncbi:MAG: ABC transporter permease [Thermoanaerobaculales bacterium]|jgi:predicted permease|nr:ABC transporter permease [Thermoanaerobaculales bacterium]